MWGARYWAGRYWGARFWGKRGFTAIGYYRSARYWARNYWARRYFASQPDSNPFTLAQTNVLAATATGLVSGNVAFTATFNVVQVGQIAAIGTGSLGGSLLYESSDFSFTPPLEMPLMTATVLLSGDLTFSAPAPGIGRYWAYRYWGARYWARRYWGTFANFNIAQTSAIAMDANGTISGGFTTLISIAQTNVLVFNASGGLSGSIEFDEQTQNSIGHGAWDGFKSSIHPLFVKLAVVDEEDKLEAFTSSQEMRDPVRISANFLDSNDVLTSTVITRRNLIRGKIRRRLVTL